MESLKPPRPGWRGSTIPRGRHDYAKLATEKHHYWGDSVGVFRKPIHYGSLSMVIMRSAVLWWANRIGGLSDASTSSTPPRLDDRLSASRVAT